MEMLNHLNYPSSTRGENGVDDPAEPTLSVTAFRTERQLTMGNRNVDQPPSSESAGTSKVSAKVAAFTVSQDPVIGTELPEDSHKFTTPSRDSAGRSTEPVPAYEDLGPLPTSYDEEQLFLVARDPHWLFTYWDFDWTRYPATMHRFAVAQFFLRVRAASGLEEPQVEIKPEARNWYVPVSRADTVYTAELGYYGANGQWTRIVESAPARTPPDSIDATALAQYATVPVHLAFERLLELVTDHQRQGEALLHTVSRISGLEEERALSSGEPPAWSEAQRGVLTALLGTNAMQGADLGSSEIDQLLRRQLHEKLSSAGASELAPPFNMFDAGGGSLFSAVGASWSAQPFSTRSERGFFLHVNAEIIFYGGTHPDAAVWIAGKQIQLSADGSFRYHFSFGDGDFAVPIVAQSPDGAEERSVMLSFVRSTQRTGEVGVSAQPPELPPLSGGK